jgi:3-mercaptopropionate dioxygenase
MQDRLKGFIEDVHGLTRTGLAPHAIAERVADHLRDLVRGGPFLESEHRLAGADAPRANLVHVAPDGSFSLVALVWGPGQATCIHDHVCWCVVGVLEGTEEETRYQLMRDAEGAFLERGATVALRPGEVCALVPPDEDVHRVRNVGADVAISLHVYGADIGVLGTSINRRFDDLEVCAPRSRAGEPLRWRDGAPLT